MTYMQWLYRAFNLQEEAEELYAQLCRERDKLMKVTAALDSIPVTSSKDPHKYEAIIDLSRHYSVIVMRRSKIVIEISSAIETVSKPKLRKLLRHRFIDSMQWKEISDKMHYSDRQIRRLYKEAIKEIRPEAERCSKKMSL